MFLNIKCKMCHQIYEDPVILPCCNKSICLKHIELTNKTKFTCGLCNECIQLPIYGFRYDNRILKVLLLVILVGIIFFTKLNFNIKLNADDVNFGGNNYLAKASCKNLEEIIKKSELLANDPRSYIRNYFESLKQEMNSKKREYMLLIEKNHQENMNELHMLQNECLNSNVLQKGLIFNDLIKESKLKLEKWNKNLKVPDLSNDVYWKRITLRAEQETSKLNEFLTYLKDDLLLFKEFKFIPKIDENNFGEILISNKNKIDPQRTEATFKLVINDFADFKNKRELRESISSCVIKNVPWRIQAEIEETETFETGLGFYVRPDKESFSLLLNPIKANIKMRIQTKLNTGSKFEKMFNYTFKDNSGRGFSPFVLMKDLMNPLNGILIKNSIVLEAQIKVY